MKRLLRGLFVLVLIVGMIPAAVIAESTSIDSRDSSSVGNFSDDILPNPLAEKQRALRQTGLEMKLNGQVDGDVAQVGTNQYADLELEQNDRVFVILAEFGEQVDPAYDGDPGPQHNQIAQPDRPEDNTTIWKANFSPQHYNRLYFSSDPGALSMVNYFAEQSSGRYTINGKVTDWVRVNYNAARYGSDYCGSVVCANVWDLIADSIDIWTQDQLDSGMTPAQVKVELDSFDVRDRYDYDGDGNFDEPDGYIDHFQIVHAGEGQETGGGAQGSDAIWSHRWYAYYTTIGSDGPGFNQLGGTEFGDSDIWVGDYTIQPENGGLGVFAHEYAHDLGLPDLYDTNPQVLGQNGYPYPSESPTGFWSLMARGSYLNDGVPRNGIGNKPAHLTAWDKFQLGWLNYDVVRAGDTGYLNLAPTSSTNGRTQAAIVVLPDKVEEVGASPDPFGEYAWWSDMGDNIDHRLTKAVTLPSDATSLTFQSYFDIEKDWDYAYVSYSLDEGDSWRNLAGNITTNSNPYGQNFGNGITGTSDANGWRGASFNIRAIAGKSILLRFRYWTDGAVVRPGFAADNIRVQRANGGSILIGDAELSDTGWTVDGFRRTQGLEEFATFNAYIAEFRAYQGFDATLKTGPYNFGFLNDPDRQNFVEHFPYQDGLLIQYWDTSQLDNNVGEHPGEGLIMPIDANPEPLYRADGTPWRSSVQVYDATFGLEATDEVTLHFNGAPSTFSSQPAVRVFDDARQYWFAERADAGVKVPNTGTRITVVSYNPQTNVMRLHVRGPR